MPESGIWGSVMRATLLLVLAIAVWFDLRERRIPNPLVLMGLVIGLASSALTGGLPALGDSLGGTLLGVVLFLPFFVLGAIGAGDAKLFGVVGSFVGHEALWAVWLYSLICGGVIGVLSVLAVRSFPRFLENMKMLAYAMFYGVAKSGLSVTDEAFGTSAKVPYAAAIALGVIIWMVRQ